MDEPFSLNLGQVLGAEKKRPLGDKSMRVESVFDRFRKFMTPGRTLIALLLLFIALPSAIVWSGVGSFGPGKGAGAGGSADSSGSKDKPSSDLELASAKAKALMSSASSGSSAGSGSGGSGGAAPEIGRAHV